MLVVGDGLDHGFGKGATATLQWAADAVGAAVEDLARNVHGAIAGVLTLGKTANDPIHGEGSTDKALEHTRLGAQQGVESLQQDSSGFGAWSTASNPARSDGALGVSALPPLSLRGATSAPMPARSDAVGASGWHNLLEHRT